VFLQQMVSTMFKDVKSTVTNGGFGEKVWREHLFTEYAKIMAEGGGVGVADQITRQIAMINGVGKDGYVSEAELDKLLGPGTRPAPGGTSIGTGAQVGRAGDTGSVAISRNELSDTGMKTAFAGMSEKTASPVAAASTPVTAETQRVQSAGTSTPPASPVTQPVVDDAPVTLLSAGCEALGDWD